MAQSYNSIINVDDYYQPPSKKKMYSSLPLSTKDELESNQSKEKTSYYKKIRNWLIIILLSYFVFFKLRFDVIYCQENDECLPIKVNIYQGISKKLFKESNLPHFPPFFDPKINDSFDLLKPDYKSSHDDKLVHTDYLLEKQEFGHTWGQIYTQSFSPNEIKEDYNFIEMSLSVSINGTQYDRLINIYLNDIMIWRSSTIEPLNRKTTRSFATKDISKYISLFKNNDDGLELKFQLDNLIAGRLDGVFVVDLKIDYYLKDAKDDNENSANLTSFEKSLLNNLNPFSPPDVLKPLFEDKKTYSQVPLLHFPITSNKKHPYKIEDLRISSTTNKLAMELFVSGNAAEEFWYSNVLDEYSKKFDEKGFTTLGHGPVRFLNVYLSNKYDTTKIFNSIPIPVVFTGGFAPSLWKPVVSLGCFDLKAIYIDLSPYLEYLKQDDYFLEFEVVSSNTEEFDIGIGDNWLISGNLLEWEQQDIEFKNTFKELSSFDDYIASAKDDEDYLKQNVTSLSILNKQFEFIFEGEEYFLQVFTENALISNISLLNYGASESSILSINSIRKYTVIDKSSEEEILIASDKTNYVFIESLNSSISTDPNIDSVYNTNAVTVYDRNINIENFQLNNDVSIVDISASQTGDAVYNISTKCGNHGKGSSVHTINTNRSWPRKDSYSRSVIVKDNKVVVDVIEN